MNRWLAWNIVFRLHESIKKHPTYKILAEMEAADRFTPSELEAYRLEKLRDLMTYCYTHVPYVREQMQAAGLAPEQIRGPEDLTRLPILRKADVRQNRARLRSDVAGRLQSFASGGSTGEPLIFDLAKRRIGARVALRQRASRWWGMSFGVPEVALWGSPLELTRQDTLRNLRDRFLATRLLSAYEMTEKMMSDYLDIIERGGIRQVFSYPSAIYNLCLHARKLGRTLCRSGVEVVFVTSEVLFPYQRELISQTFQCPVANGYGGRDSGFISHECPQGGMHLMADAIIVEILDENGRAVAPGESGEIVVTDLYSHEAPFIRYATGDMGAMSSRRCSCGRALPLFERIDGRSNDSIVTADGRIMHGQSLISVLMEIQGIERFRIYQKQVDRFHVQIIRNEHYREEGEERIRKGWYERMRAPFQVTFEYPAELPHERSGKFRHIVSEIAAGQPIRDSIQERDRAAHSS